MTNKFVLVTGGAGYVGSHVCKELARNNLTPVTFDNLSTGYAEFVKWGPLHIGDLRSKSDLKAVFEQYKIESVIHLAAKAYVSESVQNPGIYYDNNVLGSLNLIEEFVRNGCRMFVFSSSCATYGQVNESLITESTPQSPINPYGHTKLVIERALMDYADAHGFRVAILRYFNASGDDVELEIGERHSPETHLISAMIRASLKGDKFVINGNDYQTPDGTAVRDYVHVTDLSIAHIKALDYLRTNGKRLVCNLGSGSGYSILEIVSAFKELNCSKLEFEFGPRRAGDPARLVASNTISVETLKLEYSSSTIENILSSAFAWHSKESLKADNIE